MNGRYAVMAWILSVSAPSLVLADTRLHYQVDGADPVVESVLIAGDKVRINQHGGQHWMLYDRATGTMHYVNAGQREYMRFDAAQLRRQERLLEQATRYIDAGWQDFVEVMKRQDRHPLMRNPGQMAQKSLPRVVSTLRRFGAVDADLPSQGELQNVYRMFGEIDAHGGWEGWFRAISAEHYQWALDNTGSYRIRHADADTINTWPCRWSEVSLAFDALPAPTRIIDYCVAPVDEMDIPAADRELFDRFAADSAVITGIADDFEVVPAGIARELGLTSRVSLGVKNLLIEGISVQSRFYGPDQRVSSTSTLTRIERDADIDPDLFEVPAGYQSNGLGQEMEEAREGSIAMLASMQAVESLD